MTTGKKSEPKLRPSERWRAFLTGRVKPRELPPSLKEWTIGRRLVAAVLLLAVVVGLTWFVTERIVDSMIVTTDAAGMEATRSGWSTGIGAALLVFIGLAALGLVSFGMWLLAKLPLPPDEDKPPRPAPTAVVEAKAGRGTFIAAALALGGSLFLIPLAIIGSVLWVLEATDVVDVPAEVVLPVVLIVGVVGLIGALMVMVAVYKRAELQDRTEALGFPRGSVRALIALMIILLFAIVAIYLFVELDKGTNAAAQDFADQLLTTLSTLVVALAAFYFGNRSVAAAVEALTDEFSVAPSGPLGGLVDGVLPFQLTPGDGVTPSWRTFPGNEEDEEAFEYEDKGGGLFNLTPRRRGSYEISFTRGSDTKRVLVNVDGPNPVAVEPDTPQTVAPSNIVEFTTVPKDVEWSVTGPDGGDKKDAISGDAATGKYTFTAPAKNGKYVVAFEVKDKPATKTTVEVTVDGDAPATPATAPTTGATTVEDPTATPQAATPTAPTTAATTVEDPGGASDGDGTGEEVGAGEEEAGGADV